MLSRFRSTVLRESCLVKPEIEGMSAIDTGEPAQARAESVKQPWKTVESIGIEDSQLGCWGRLLRHTTILAVYCGRADHR